MATVTPNPDEQPTEAIGGSAWAIDSTHESALPVGTQIGSYRTLALLGQGGMGAVYRAEQLQPVHRIVALKLLTGQRLQARHLAHFEVERQLLARMQHPGIAQIFDAGATDDGIPYFAMELVEGQPITFPQTLRSLNNLASLRQRMGDLEGARTLQEQAVAARRQQLGPEHPDTVRAELNLAGLLRDSQQLEDAQALADGVLARLRVGSREADAEYLQALDVAASIAIARGRVDVAQAALRERLQRLRQSQGEQHPDALATAVQLYGLMQEHNGDAQALLADLQALAALAPEDLSPPLRERREEALKHLEQGAAVRP